MYSIAMISAKGGVGKTSCTLHLGGTLARMGRRVLLVDCDAQSSLTQGFVGPNALRSLDPMATIAAAWSSEPLLERITLETGIERLSLVPGHYAASAWDLPFAEDRLGELNAIWDVLSDARDDYDYVLIDCPPQMYSASYAAMIAATHVIVPVQCEDYGSTGMVTVSRAIRVIQESRGRPEILGYLLSMFNKSLGVHQAYAESLRDLHGGLVLENPVPLLATYKESVAARLPVSHYKPKSAAAKVFVALAQEIEQRLEGERGQVFSIAG